MTAEPDKQLSLEIANLFCDFADRMRHHYRREEIFQGLFVAATTMAGEFMAPAQVASWLRHYADLKMAAAQQPPEDGKRQ
jgi:hypothetical protein